MEKQIEFEFIIDEPVAERSEFIGYVDGLEASPELDLAEARWHHVKLHEKACSNGNHILGCQVELFKLEED